MLSGTTCGAWYFFFLSHFCHFCCGQEKKTEQLFKPFKFVVMLIMECFVVRWSVGGGGIVTKDSFLIYPFHWDFLGKEFFLLLLTLLWKIFFSKEWAFFLNQLRTCFFFSFLDLICFGYIDADANYKTHSTKVCGNVIYRTKENRQENFYVSIENVNEYGIYAMWWKIWMRYRIHFMRATGIKICHKPQFEQDLQQSSAEWVKLQ